MRFILLMLVCVALPAALVYVFGWWALAACGLAVAGLCMFSVRPARGVEATRGGSLTRYDTGLDG